MTSTKMTEDEKRKARNAYMREYLRRRYAESEEFRKKRREWNKPSTLRYIKAHPDRVKARQRRYHERLKAGKEAEYLRMFQELDGRILFIGCSLDTDSDARKIIGRRVVLKGGDNETIWQGKTYGVKCSWLQMLCHSYRQFRKERDVR